MHAPRYYTRLAAAEYRLLQNEKDGITAIDRLHDQVCQILVDIGYAEPATDLSNEFRSEYDKARAACLN